MFLLCVKLNAIMCLIGYFSQVGAGPTGLVAALSLAQNGVNVRIVDKLPEYFRGQRGAGIMVKLYHRLTPFPEVV